ncbi:MAG: tetratricopeptide repeat protein [Chloroflexi bacterium]|nr:tetratricopeptide repeat protein [Chloroflexota bacterium]
MILRFLSAFYGGMKSLSSGFYYNWGMTYARWGQPAKAMYYLNRAAKLNSTGAQIYYQRGLLFIAMGQPEAAIHDFDTAIGANPQYLEAYLNRSMMHAVIGRHEDAQNDVEKAVSLGADRPSLESQIAELRKQNG